MKLRSIGKEGWRVYSVFRKDRAHFPVVLREALERLGTLGIKAGQIASTRFDMLPSDVVVELSTLREQAEMLTWEEIEQSLTEPDKAALAGLDVDRNPIASASVAQVHVAKAADGTKYAVKIVRPKAKRDIEEGVKLMRRYSIALRLVLPFLSRHRLFVDQLRELLLSETDFTIEATNMKVAKEVGQGYAVPEVVWDRTSTSVLVMEYVEGVTLNRVSEQEYAKSLPATLTSICLTGIIKTGFFHADMHPGNVVVEGEQVTLLDWGMVGWVSKRNRYYLTLLSKGFLDFNEEMVTEAVLGLCDYKRVNRGRLESDLQKCMYRYTSIPLGRINFSSSLADLLGILRKHRVFIKPELVAVIKSLVTVQGVAVGLDGSINIRGMLKEFTPLVYRESVAYVTGRVLLDVQRQIMKEDAGTGKRR